MTTFDLMTLPDEPYEVHVAPVDFVRLRLDTIERRLNQVEDELRGRAADAAPRDEESVCATCIVNTGLLEETREERDNWEDQFRTLFDLVEEIQAIVKPSTSKLAITVRAAIDRWAAPEDACPEQEDEPEREGDVNRWKAPAVEPVPAHDADVDEWRAYARSRGFAGPDIDKANRSQIRTMLGIEQPVES